MICSLSILFFFREKKRFFYLLDTIEEKGRQKGKKEREKYTEPTKERKKY